VTRRHPLIRLIAKELRLQQLAIAVAAVWALAYTIIVASGARAMHPFYSYSSSLLVVLTVFYTLVLPVVIGSLACAEERQFGTLDAQLLLPVRSSTQWIIKSATAFGLAVTLAVLLPLGLARMFGAAPITLTTDLVLVVLAVSSISLYVSTLARSGMWALICSVGVVFASGVLIFSQVFSSVGRKVFAVVHAARAPHTHLQFMPLTEAYILVPLCGFAVLAVTLALPNFRYAARRPALIAAHIAIAVAYVMACEVIVNVIRALKY
jgi:hypothetical protein